MRISRLLIAGALVATAAVAVPTIASQAIPTGPAYYVSLGDSLSVGYQPGLGDTTQGFSEDVYNALHAHLTQLQLVKFGCSGETTTTFINGGKCMDGRYPITGTQLGDAVAFITQHRGEIPYISIDIGANDVDGCATGGSINAACLVQGEKTIAQNLNTILAALKAADKGGFAQKVGMAYYDPFLAAWLTGTTGQTVAAASVTALAAINLTESSEYTAYGFKVADVFTQYKTSKFLPLVNTPPYGKVPTNVATICNWTYMCSQQNIHPNPTGYQQIANAFLKRFTFF
jgi:lysophospholipase L1-like esterase